MDDFLPATLDGWLALVVQVGGLLLGAWAVMVNLIRKPLLKQINGVGGRVRDLEKSDAVHAGKLEELGRHEQTRAFQWAAISERLGKMEGSHANLQGQVNEGMSELKERLAAMESTLKFIARQFGGREQE